MGIAANSIPAIVSGTMEVTQKTFNVPTSDPGNEVDILEFSGKVLIHAVVLQVIDAIPAGTVAFNLYRRIGTNDTTIYFADWQGWAVGRAVSLTPTTESGTPDDSAVVPSISTLLDLQPGHNTWRLRWDTTDNSDTPPPLGQVKAVCFWQVVPGETGSVTAL